MRIVPILLILSAFLFILFQKATIRIRKTENITATFSLTFFSVSLTDLPEKKGRIKKLMRFLKNVPIIFKSLAHFLKRTDVKVLRFKNQDQSPFPISFGQKLPFYLSAPFIFGYLNNTAKSVSYDENWLITTNISNENDAAIDVLFTFRLFYLIISALLFLYYKVKNRIIRGVKDV